MSLPARPPLGLTDAVSAPRHWAERLRKRRIAVATRRDGRIVAVRPDSALARVNDDVSIDQVVEEAERVGLRLSTVGGAPRWVGHYLRFDVDPDEHRAGWSVRPVASRIDLLAERGVKLRPNHVYLASSPGLQHPAVLANASFGRGPDHTTARRTTPLVLGPPSDLPGHRRPRVLVLDTGLRTTSVDGRRVVEHEELRHCAQIHDPWRSTDAAEDADDEDEPHGDRDGAIDLCAGHGTFIAGVIRRICPDAEIHVDGVLSSFGEGDDDTVVTGIARALSRSRDAGFDIAVLSFGATTADDRYPPLAPAVRQLATNGRTVVVASAGNESSPQPSWPAAMPEVVGVGALDGAGRAWFSNYGGWVDACAPGVDIVSTFFCDAEDRDGDRVTRFDGWASWNGTSFAAPIVAATIAQEMYLHGDTAPEAWRRLSDWRRPRVADLGVVFPG